MEKEDENEKIFVLLTEMIYRSKVQAVKKIETLAGTSLDSLSKTI